MYQCVLSCKKKFKKSHKQKIKCYGFDCEILEKSVQNLSILRRRFEPFILFTGASNPARWIPIEILMIFLFFTSQIRLLGQKLALYQVFIQKSS